MQITRAYCQLTVSHILKLHANAETLQTSKKSLISEHYDEIVSDELHESHVKVFVDPSELLLQGLTKSVTTSAKRLAARDCSVTLRTLTCRRSRRGAPAGDASECQGEATTHATRVEVKNPGWGTLWLSLTLKDLDGKLKAAKTETDTDAATQPA